MNLPLDENSRKGGACALNTDPTQIQPITFHPSTHGMSVVDGSAQTDNGNHGGQALIDENSRSSWYGLSSTGSGERIIVYANSSGAVLIQST